MWIRIKYSFNTLTIFDSRMPLKPASAKAKGRLLQQHIAKEVLRCFPSLTEDDVRSTTMGANGTDVQLSRAARDAFPYSVECKAVEKLNMWAAWEQCKANVKQGDVPLLVCKKNRSEVLAVLPWPHFANMLAGNGDGVQTVQTANATEPGTSEHASDDNREPNNDADHGDVIATCRNRKKRLREAMNAAIGILDEMDEMDEMQNKVKRSTNVRDHEDSG